MVFEFIIAVMLFFTIIFFMLNYMNTAVSGYDRDFFQEDMESKASQVSELLVMNNGVWVGREPVVLGISAGWPVLNSTKIQWLKNYCIYPANYSKLADSLGVHPRTMMKIQINETWSDGSLHELANCSVREPVSAKIESKRFAINETGGIIVISVKIW